MSENLEVVNLFLFAFLVSGTLYFGIKNKQYLKKLFHQSEERNTIELRPIITFNYIEMRFYSPKDDGIDNDSVDSYYKKYKPSFLKMEIEFHVKNKGKMVAQEIESDLIIDGIRSEVIPQTNRYVDLSPTEAIYHTLTFKIYEFKQFTIDIKVNWKYGHRKKGQLHHIIMILPSTTHMKYLQKKVSLDYDDKK